MSENHKIKEEKMGKTITAILGSPRKNGVTARITDAFMDHARQKGSSAQSYFLNTMDFKGCQGCHQCKTKTEACVLKDDLTPALEDLKKSDILVFASPIYFWDVTGQFKSFFDRTWSLVKPDYQTNHHPVRLDKGKTAVWVTSQGDVKEKFKEVVDKYSGFLAMYGFETHIIRAFGMDDIPKNLEIEPFLAQASNLAKKLLG